MKDQIENHETPSDQNAAKLMKCRQQAVSALQRHLASAPEAAVVITMKDGVAQIDLTEFADVKDLTFAQKLFNAHVDEAFAEFIMRGRVGAAKAAIAKAQTPGVQPAAAGLPTPECGAV